MNYSSTLHQSDCDKMVVSSSLQIYAGQSTECDLTVLNGSSIPVEMFDLQLVAANRPAATQVFSFRFIIFSNLITVLIHPWMNFYYLCTWEFINALNLTFYLNAC